MANLFTRAKEYTKAHPRTSYQDAIKKLSGKKIAGIKVKKAPAKKAAPKKARIAAVPVKVASTRPGTIGAIPKARKLVNEIEKLEKTRAKEKTKEMKDILALQINAHHRELKKIATKLKSA